jgi:hypothetical protein
MGERSMAVDVIPSAYNKPEISIGDALIRTLWKAYGAHFAQGCRDNEKLCDVLHQMDEPSLSTLIHVK